MMRRIVLAALAALALAQSPAHAWLAQSGTPAPATTEQVFYMATSTAVNTTATRWMSFAMTAPAINTEIKSFRFPEAGTILGLRMYSATTLASGSYAGTVRLGAGGGSQADTSAACSGATATPCTWSGSVSVNAGDVASFRIDPSTSPAPSAAAIIHATVLFRPATADHTVIAYGTPANNFATGSTQYQQAGGGLNPNGTLSNRQSATVPIGGTISKLCTAWDTALTQGSYTITSYKAGVVAGAPGNLANVIDTANQAVCDTANSITVTGPSGGSTPGSDLALESVPAGTPTAGRAAGGMIFVPSSTGRFPVFASGGAAAGTGTTAKNYYPLSSGATTAQATRTDAESLALAQTIDGMTCKWQVAAGSGATRVCNLMVNGSPAMTCSITGTTQTACNATGTVAVNDNDKLVYEDDPTTGSAPAGATFNASLVAHR